MSGCPEPGDAGLSASLGDLAAARAAGSDALAGHAAAWAVAADGDGWIVALTVGDEAGAERTRLIWLGHDGVPIRQVELDRSLGAARAIAALNGGWVVVGEEQTGPVDFVARLVHLDGGGKLKDARTFGDGGDTGFSAVAIGKDGVVIAGGARRGHGWLVRDPTQAEVDGALDITGLTTTADGYLWVGSRERSTTQLGLALIGACGDDLTERWRRAVPGAGRGELASVAAVDGGAVAIGHREEDAAAPAAPAALWCLRIDCDGTTVWERSLRTLGGGAHRGRAVSAVPGGDVIVAGDGPTDGGRTGFAARLSDAGEVVWAQPFEEGPEVMRAVAATTDGILVAGSDGRDALVRMLGSGGEPRWERRLAAASAGS